MKITKLVLAVVITLVATTAWAGASAKSASGSSNTTDGFKAWGG